VRTDFTKIKPHAKLAIAEKLKARLLSLITKTSS
jgi:hypothetical protein